NNSDTIIKPEIDFDDGDDNIIISDEDSNSSMGSNDDEMPLGSMTGDKDIYNIVWGKHDKPMQIQNFMTKSDDAQFIKDMFDPTPYDILNLLFSENILSHIVFHTNLYAQQNFLKIGKTYKQTNIHEIKTFLGINFKLCVLNHFDWLLSIIHLHNNVMMPSRQSPKYDKLYKVRPFLNMLKHNFNKCFYPQEHLAINE
uniref:PiggyBac transposable element-derived protein domain-containing protein n=1 Tax=Strongyloides stercoralis TaxID=6248 RepID=A0AAF5DMQ3_STRER